MRQTESDLLKHEDLLNKQQGLPRMHGFKARLRKHRSVLVEGRFGSALVTCREGDLDLFQPGQLLYVMRVATFAKQLNTTSKVEKTALLVCI